MRALDDIIVRVATRTLRGVMAVRTGFVYIQFFALALVVALAGTVALAVIYAFVKRAFHGN